MAIDIAILMLSCALFVVFAAWAVRLAFRNERKLASRKRVR